MVFENGVKNIQAAAYNGARTVIIIFLERRNFFLTLNSTIAFQFLCIAEGLFKGQS